MKTPSIYDMVGRAGRAAPPPTETQAEEGEAKVVSEPKLDKAALGYMEPRKGVDAPTDFRSCASCVNMIPERIFRAATQGNRCLILGMSVDLTDYCNKYSAWPLGKPDERVLEANALLAIDARGRGAVDMVDAGYCSDDDHKHLCRCCKHFDLMGEPDDPGPGCELMEQLVRDNPDIWGMTNKINPDGGCNGWSEIVPDEPSEAGEA